MDSSALTSPKRFAASHSAGLRATRRVTARQPAPAAAAETLLERPWRHFTENPMLHACASMTNEERESVGSLRSITWSAQEASETIVLMQTDRLRLIVQQFYISGGANWIALGDRSIDPEFILQQGSR